MRTDAEKVEVKIGLLKNTINCPVFDNVDQPINKRNMIDNVTDSMASILNHSFFFLKLLTVIGVKEIN